MVDLNPVEMAASGTVGGGPAANLAIQVRSSKPTVRPQISKGMASPHKGIVRHVFHAADSGLERLWSVSARFVF